MKAIWQESVIAESDETIVIEGNHYFPRESVHREFLVDSDTHTHCHWKGEASYYHIEVDGKLNKDAAWYYPETKAAAKDIEDHIAFWHGVEVIS